MKNLNRGKNLMHYLLFILAGLFLSTAPASAVSESIVQATLDKPALYRGDHATLTLSGEGKDVQFPNIYDIGGVKVIGTSSSSNMSIINGKVTQKISKSYSFAPTQNMSIPAYTVTVDGKKYQTKALKLSVVEPKASAKGDEFILEIDLDKEKVYVGQSVTLNVKFKHKLNAKANKIDISEPEINNFWIKKVDGIDKHSEGDYIVQAYKYIMFPQKSGDFDIPALVAQIGVIKQQRGSRGFFNDPFFNGFGSTMQTKKIYSNTANLQVEPLPNNLDIYGSFNLSVEPDTTEVHANKPLNLTIKITGTGNIDDIKKFDLNIPSAVIYSDEPKVDTGLHNGKYAGEFTQKIAIIADRDYTIPAIEFTYFNEKTQTQTTKRSAPIKVKVIGSASYSNSANNKNNSNQQAAEPQLEQSKELVQAVNAQEPSSKSVEKIVTVADTKQNYLFLAIGFILGIVSKYIFDQLNGNKRVNKEIPVIKQIQKVKKNDRLLFDVLLPYKGECDAIDEVLVLLEENLYGNKKNPIEIKKIIEYFEQLEEE
jgi:hypothetical protein